MGQRRRWHLWKSLPFVAVCCRLLPSDRIKWRRSLKGIGDRSGTLHGEGMIWQIVELEASRLTRLNSGI